MSRTHAYRPMLLPGLRPLWRGGTAVQLGLDSRRAVVVDLADPSAVEVLTLLDGAHTEESVIARARKLGLAEEVTRGFLRELAEARLVIAADDLLPAALPPEERDRLTAEAGALAHAGRSPARVLAHRRSQRVVVSGTGRLAALVSHGLLDAGVGKVGRLAPGSRGPRRVVPAVGTSTRVRVSAANLTIDVRTGLPPAPATTRAPVLAVTTIEGTVIVGPMVPASGGPCLRCLDLHRTDRDPQWPQLAAQLETATTPGVCESATLLAAAGFIVGESLELLDGAQPSIVGGCVEISGPDRTRRRRWDRHPGCGC